MPSSTAAAHGYADLLGHISDSADRYPKPEHVSFGYGTAGFRTTATLLPSVVFRVGLLAVLRSKRLDGATIGVMVTASHNPEADNGVKLVDPSGEMLEQAWESHATALANCPSTTSLVSTFTTLATHLHIKLDTPASVVIARDTRPSGPELIDALTAGITAFGASVKLVDLGVTTTPVLHYVTKAINDRSGDYGKPTVEGYYEKMAAAFKTLIGNRGPLPPIYVDCANGVGALALSEFSSRSSELITLKALNDETTKRGALNYQCGADYVKTRQALPPSVAAAGVLAAPDLRGASFDGDADRIVYYYLRDSKTFRLLDGDKIAVLAAVFFSDLVRKAKLDGEDGLTVGVVQTAYANGNSTKYIKSRHLPVTCVATGVKHLHHAAQSYDIGVYFEANGHGTVLFSSQALNTLKTAEPVSPDSATAIKHLIALYELVNQAVGDALSDLLLVEVILAHRGWNASDWDAGYEDLPNRLVKVEVPDRSVFKTTDAERQLSSPPGVQAKIDSEVKKVELGRSFVRPSGTEDCVRVYAEAATSTAVDSLVLTVAEAVKAAALDLAEMSAQAAGK